MSDPSFFDLQPVLTGTTLQLRPLRPEDFAGLHAVASDPLIWEQHPHPDRWQREVFAEFFTGAMQSGGAFAVTDKATGNIIGASRYYEWAPDSRSVAIGYTFLARSHWGGSSNREMKQLLLDHAFRFADTAWFHVGKHNWRSRKAMEKIGAILSHEDVREHNGIAYDYVYFKITAPR
jgi:RimJ/RimL family protein N-acetyltransferase